MRSCILVLLSLSLCSGGFARNYSFSVGSSQVSWDALRGKAVRDDSVEHNSQPSLRVESSNGSDAFIVSKSVELTIGKRYVLSGWIKTNGLHVTDSGRTPIAVGAALTMASMPWDMHSASVGATHDWTHVQLEFTATRASDNIALSVADTGSFQGDAWFQGVSLDESSPNSAFPKAASVRTLGPGYRYPSGGWIYLHIEGKPYDRGYQHGFLMAKEIDSYIERCIAAFGGDAKTAWEQGRIMANADFLRGYDQELLEEMRGIADGASAAGARIEGRKLDLVDIVTLNSSTEIADLRSALPLTPTGLETLDFHAPSWKEMGVVPPNARCSAFAATGKATRDGKMVMGHITMWGLTYAEQVNVMLDIKPVTGHRVMMQSYPGGIQSGMDWYQNDSGVVLSETTIRQSPFDIEGTPEAYRARKAAQYGTSVAEVAKILTDHNNGLYTNEWLIGDAKNNEIGMLELGTHKTRLYDSAKNDWFGGTEGFYWGCNNAKDLNVRLEYAPDPKGVPQDLPYSPAPRDITWQNLYHQYKGKIDQQFGFLAFRTAPLVTATSFDAKITDSDLASRMMLWAVYGKPNEREWVPNERQKKQYEGNEGIYSSGYRVFDAPANDGLLAQLQPQLTEIKPAPPAKTEDASASGQRHGRRSVAAADSKYWKGWLLPATRADLWLTAGSAAYYDALTSQDVQKTLESYRTRLRGLQLTQDRPLSQMNGDIRSMAWDEIARLKGALFLDALRQKMGDHRFDAAMNAFYSDHTTKTVTTAQFLEALKQDDAKLDGDMISAWLDKPGLPGAEKGPLYIAEFNQQDLANSIIVYGTVTEAGANRYAAEHLQSKALDRMEKSIPMFRDYEVTEADLRSHNVIFVGRPETNSALADWAEKLQLPFDGDTFTLGKTAYGSENDSLLMGVANPDDRTKKVLIIAGNSAIATVRGVSDPANEAQYAVLDHDHVVGSGFLQ
ncbi:MAG TPA: C45 family autoproteolytic acyltransferase/hydrolase [Bryobacteraceae bacterium]|nr:C45 family autoproteolytic acyltransferase/hydrolase [Bryobacteraceae bacterium]